MCIIQTCSCGEQKNRVYTLHFKSQSNNDNLFYSYLLGLQFENLVASKTHFVNILWKFFLQNFHSERIDLRIYRLCFNYSNVVCTAAFTGNNLFSTLNIVRYCVHALPFTYVYQTAYIYIYLCATMNYHKK